MTQISQFGSILDCISCNQSESLHSTCSVAFDDVQEVVSRKEDVVGCRGIYPGECSSSFNAKRSGSTIHLRAYICDCGSLVLMTARLCHFSLLLLLLQFSLDQTKAWNHHLCSVANKVIASNGSAQCKQPLIGVIPHDP